ncbi:hypothetical protein CAP39_13050 [Sphingomonas sp. IBVSS1]|nr:hypothetical protein CAP39_13050 [Sphingomonas sp. IBVSS1]
MAYQYKVGGRPVVLDVDPSLVAVRFAGGTRGDRAAALSNAGAGPLASSLDLEPAGVSIVAAPSAAHPLGWQAGTESLPVLAALEAQDAVAGAQPVFKVGDGHAVTCGKVIIGAEPGSNIDALLADHGLALLSREEERVLASIPDGADIFAVVEALDADQRTLYAEPDFLLFGTHMPQRTGPVPPALPATFQNQYALHITGTIAAWAIQQGSPQIRVAVLDDGVDITHHDLAPAVVATYDAIDRDSFQAPNPTDWHGTACAGLAVARKTGPGSVAGVGAGASLVAVRLAQSHTADRNWVTSNAIIAHAIDWAWSTGRADIISNSWGGGAESNAVTSAINRARTSGRGGLGAVVLAAAGNNGGAVNYPANLPGVLAVAASNQFDEAKTKTTADNETNWASCLGPEIDVAAPGVQNRTTDVIGGLGYSDGDYAPRFNGTSSATPLVAGACALVLSKNPHLTEAQVRNLITGTADKVGQFAYQNGRNDFMGFGRLNVLAAVRQA